VRRRLDILLAAPVARAAAMRADRALADALAIALRARRSRRPPAEVGELVRDALDAALLPAGRRVAVLGDPGPVTGADITATQSLERLRPAAVPAAIRRLGAAADAVLVVAPVWPAARSGSRTLRRASWWTEAAAVAGLEPLVELRRQAAGRVCLVLRHAVAQPEPPPAAPRSGSREPRLRINDDLSRDTSFAWISASIALALERLGVAVSIAPTELPPSLEPGRRRALGRLIERGAPPRPASEIGWTHFWEAYRRPLHGEHPLALYATNVRFARADRGAWDPWMAELVSGSLPLAPISSFCREVLLEAGVPPDRTDIVPLAPTEGLQPDGGGTLRGARTLKVLHVTNASDPLRHGTDVALAGFAGAFAPDDDVTLVVRDYWRGDSRLAAEVQALAGRGYDARYLPAFYPPDRLGAFLAAFDLLLAPFRGEGFGIKLLDAMACGVAPLAPRFGGPADFLDPEASFPLPHGLEPVTAGYDASELALGNGPLWARVAPADVAVALRESLADVAETARRGERARAVAAGFTWERTAAAIVASVERRAGQAPARR